jgi:tetratricopeptide (TPR) repeat protein
MAKKAKKLDPLSLPIATALSFACFFAGDLEQAKHVAEKILELNDRYAFAYESLGFVCEAQGKLEHAVRQYEKAADYSGRWPAILGYLGYAYALSGNLTMARQVEHELEQKPEYVPSFEVAAIRLGLGDEEGCMRSLARAYGERSHRLLLLKNDARFERLSANADFRSLLSRVFKR